MARRRYDRGEKRDEESARDGREQGKSVVSNVDSISVSHVDSLLPV
jgi:hypothetical protein